MSPSLLGVLVATAYTLVNVDAYSNGAGSCVAGFDKFPVGSEHNWQESTRPGGLLADNYGDVAFSGMTLTLGDTELQRPVGSDQFHYTGECDADYLCGMCQGSCSGDTGCAEGLACFLRDADEAVPGCSGTVGLWDGVGYCYDPTGRKLQGQTAQVDAAFQVGTPYMLRLEAPADTPFKGFMFRLEGEGGEDLSDGAIEMVTDNMQVLESTGEMDGNGINVQATCAPTVAAACHTEPEDKAMAEAMITFPQAGAASLEVTVMVGEHEWYLTNYALQFEASTGGETTPPTDSTPTADDAPSASPPVSPGETMMPTDPPADAVPSPPSATPPALEADTSGTKQTVLSLFAAVALVGLGLDLTL